MENILYVMLGGGIGSVLRYLVTSTLQRVLNLEHYATFWVNISGCFILGFLMSIMLDKSDSLYFFLILGITASYTTFSTFEYENIDLIAHERYIEFLRYSILSCLCGFMAVLAGIFIAKLVY